MNIESNNTSEIKQIILSPEKIADILYYAFKLSRGTFDLQGKLFHLIAWKYPDYRISQDNLKKALPIVLEGAKKFQISKRGSIHHNDYSDEGLMNGEGGINQIARSFMQILSPQYRKELELEFKEEGLEFSYEDDLEDVIERIIETDQGFITREELYNTDEQYAKAILMPSFVNFVLRGVSTGSEEFDLIFKDMNTYVQKNIDGGIWTRSNKKELFDLIDYYNSKFTNKTLNIKE